MYISQFLLSLLDKLLDKNKVVIIYGPRRVGKTTLLEHYLEDKDNYLLVNGEDIHVQHYLSSQSIETLKTFVGNHQLLAIDEAQVIPHIGLNLKLLIDHCKKLKIIVTGSSAFDLANQFGEPLTGRKISLQLFPLSQIELQQIEQVAQTRAKLEERLIFGNYPEVILQTDYKEKQAYLRELVSAYLYKDILKLEGIRKPDKIIQLLQLLAFQIGQEVSHNELSQQLGLNKLTVERYLDLLQKCFVLIKVNGFSRNLRKEVAKKPRYYFYDLGIRNAIINQFNPLNLRDDIGKLWENYIIAERLKKQHYMRIETNNYFWRSYSKQEIDWVEERDGTLYAYEIKWRTQKVKPPSEWQKNYPNTKFMLINRDNYLDFIL